MRRCKCLRYKCLQLLKRKTPSTAWLFHLEDGLMPVEAYYQLAEFDRGNVIQICPYYLYLSDERRISSAFFEKNKLSKEEIDIIENAVNICPNIVNLDK